LEAQQFSDSILGCIGHVSEQDAIFEAAAATENDDKGTATALEQEKNHTVFVACNVDSVFGKTGCQGFGGVGERCGLTRRLLSERTTSVRRRQHSKTFGRRRIVTGSLKAIDSTAWEKQLQRFKARQRSAKSMLHDKSSWSNNKSRLPKSSLRQSLRRRKRNQTTRLTFAWEEQRIAMMDIMILLPLLLLPKTIQSSSFSPSYQRWDVAIMGRCHYSIHRRR